jgi:hypothetical protein
MDTSAMMKEEIIREYISKINIKNGNFSIKVIKEDLRRLLREIPAIQVNWKKDEVLTEIKGQSKVVDSVKSITIAFSDGEDANGNPKVHSVVYYI